MALHEPDRRENRGRVTYLDPSGEWGYVDAADDRRFYFRCSAVLPGVGHLEVGSAVRFEEAGGDGTEEIAVRIRLVPGDSIGTAAAERPETD
jgi:hypothetical protein